MNKNPKMEEANRIMLAYPEKKEFKDKRSILIWAAKFDACPKCNAKPRTPCINQSSSTSKRLKIATVWPHEERINWDRLVQALKDKGYVVHR